MKKSQIMDLIESYHGEFNCSPLLAQIPYQKGWVKRFFDSRTHGILELETYLESETVRQLAPDDEIQGTNLVRLLKIISARDQRIYKTGRSYEDAPDKSTNRVYNRLYHLLQLDAVIQAEIGVPFPHSKILHQTIFSRAIKQVLAAKEQQANQICANRKQPQKANAGYLRLGLALIFKKNLCHRFASKEEPSLEGLTHCVRSIKYQGQILEIEFHFLKGELHDAKLLSAKIQCRQDIDTGIQWLNLASGNGDKNASLHLAAFYARRKNYRQVNRDVDPDKTIELLSLACEQGSKLAALHLDENLSFGMVSISDANSYSLG